MHNIQQEINHLLQDQDFLVLPGIGAFLAEYTKPHFNTQGGIVLSQKTLSFNPLIDRDVDYKLFHLLSKKLNIPFELAKSNYFDFLNNFRSTLGLQNKYDWENVGIFYKNENHEIVFYPEKQLHEETVVKEIITETTVLQTNSFEVPEDHLKHSNKELELDSADRKQNYFKVLLYVVPLFLITTTLAYTIFVKPLNKKTEKKNMVEEIDSLANLQKDIIGESVNTTNEKTEVSSKTKEKKNDSQSEKEKANERESDSSRKSHIVGIGIFKVKENVDNLAAYLAENGIPARVRKSGGKYKLFVTASTEEQATKFVNKIEQLTGEKAVYENN